MPRDLGHASKMFTVMRCLCANRQHRLDREVEGGELPFSCELQRGGDGAHAGPSDVRGHACAAHRAEILQRGACLARFRAAAMTECGRSYCWISQGVQGFFNAFISGKAKDTKEAGFAHNLTYIDRSTFNAKARDTPTYCTMEMERSLEAMLDGEETRTHVLHFMVSRTR
eukprot:scaffold693_cov399-Prasinococcus_capsulatus_cf.AAC.32